MLEEEIESLKNFFSFYTPDPLDPSLVKKSEKSAFCLEADQ